VSTSTSDSHRRSIGLLGATAIGVGGMVGGGIFAVLGVAAEKAGGATPVAFAIAGLVAGLTAYSYARLSVRYVSAGGTVTFVDRAFGIGEVTGSLNIVLWAGYIVTAALYASAFGHYSATLFVGDPQAAALPLFIAVGVVVPWLINLVDASLVARSETLVVAAKVAILMVVIVAGAPHLSPGRLDPAAWPSPLSIVSAGMLIFVAYEGFELIANASSDARRPTTTLPRAFGLSVGLVVVLYVVIAIVTVGSLSAARIEQTADYALAAAASTSLGQVGFTLVGVSAVLATFSAINATLYGTARLSFTIASEGELPDALERRAWNQPIGLHITAVLALGLAVAMPVASISAMASAIFLVVFAVVNAAELRTEPSRAARVVAAAGVVGCAVSLVVLVADALRTDPAAIVVLAVLVAAALVGEHAVLKSRRPGALRLPTAANPLD
jgi:amino acid transporter